MRPFSILTIRGLDRIVTLKRKTTRQGGFFEGSVTGKFLNRGNWLGGAQSPKLVLSV